VSGGIDEVISSLSPLAPACWLCCAICGGQSVNRAREPVDISFADDVLNRLTQGSAPKTRARRAMGLAAVVVSHRVR